MSDYKENEVDNNNMNLGTEGNSIERPVGHDANTYVDDYVTQSGASENDIENAQGSEVNENIDTTYHYAYKAGGTAENADFNSDTPTAKQLKKAAREKRKLEKKQKRECRRAKPKGFATRAVQVAGLAVLFGLISGGVFYGVNQIDGNTGANNVISMNTVQTARKTDGTMDVAGGATTLVDASDVVDTAMPSIVSISATTKEVVQNFFGQAFSQEVPSSGSGIIIGQDDDNLYIATNNHVVENTTELSVGFIDGKASSATVVGTSSVKDLAVVSVEKKDVDADTLNAISVAKLGDSQSLEVGEPTIAIGNALGYGQSVTVGVVSAVNRTVSDDESGVALIQTDAAINPGNSGGALLNSKGEVIGINSSKFADTNVEGMGFAIPISTAEPVFEKIMTSGATVSEDQGYLGIYGGNVEEDMAKVYNMPEGVYVTKVVTGEAAEKAGLKVGDIITGFNEDSITTIEQLQEEVSYFAAGDKVTLTVKRNVDGNFVDKTIIVVLGKRPQNVDN